MARVILRPSAQDDLADIFSYLGERSGLAVADRFFAGFQTACTTLAAAPDMAPTMGLSPPLHMLRRWPVKGFENWLIAYQHHQGVVDVVRIIRGARDLTAELEC